MEIFRALNRIQLNRMVQVVVLLHVMVRYYQYVSTIEEFGDFENCTSGLEVSDHENIVEVETAESQNCSSYGAPENYDDVRNWHYYYRARHYDPTTGRFLQNDPLGYVDSMNLYQGMNMNPWNYVDPMGTVLHWRGNSEIEAAYTMLLGIFASNPNLENKLDILRRSNINYYIKDGSGIISDNALGEFQIDPESNTGTLYINLTKFNSSWSSFTSDGLKISPNFTSLNSDLLNIERYKGLQNVTQGIAANMAHEMAHAVEADRDWERRKRFARSNQSLKDNMRLYVSALTRMKRDRDFRRYARRNNLSSNITTYFEYLENVKNDSTYSELRQWVNDAKEFNEVLRREESFVTYPYGKEVEDKIRNR